MLMVIAAQATETADIVDQKVGVRQLVRYPRRYRRYEEQPELNVFGLDTRTAPGRSDAQPDAIGEEAMHGPA